MTDVYSGGVDLLHAISNADVRSEGRLIRGDAARSETHVC